MTPPHTAVILPYYRNPAMLKVQLHNWSTYSEEALEKLQLIIVDDGSPEPALPIVEDYRQLNIQVFRVLVDIPWNRNGARNLGAKVATTPWIFHMDIDHLMPPESADRLVNTTLLKDRWYRFERFRVGAADETRNKDALPRDAKFGKIKPHIDSYLCQRKLYWDVGGYDEDYSGSLGGGSPFLKQLEAAAPVQVLPIPLHVYTRHTCPDASDVTLDRSRDRYMRIRKEKDRTRQTKAKNPIRFKWNRVL